LLIWQVVVGALQLLGLGQEVFLMAEASQVLIASGARNTKDSLPHWYVMPPQPALTILPAVVVLAILQVPPTSVAQPLGQYLLSFHSMIQ